MYIAKSFFDKKYKKQVFQRIFSYLEHKYSHQDSIVSCDSLPLFLNEMSYLNEKYPKLARRRDFNFKKDYYI
jgi:hypothetical protein